MSKKMYAGTWRVLTSLVFGSLLVPLSVSAERACPFGMLSSQGTCCEVGSEYVQSKHACMPTRPERRCVQGHLDDCVEAARSLENRGAVGAGYAVELYRYACDDGYAPACRGLGTLYDRGTGVAKDSERALTLWEDACDQGDAHACTLLARGLVRDGAGPTRVMRVLLVGCHRGDAEGCSDYAAQLERDPAQESLAAVYFERACTAGASRACRALLDRERRFDTLAAKREHELLERACRASDPASCGELGDSVYARDQSEEAVHLAARHYQVACDGGFAPACERLAEWTLSGRGVARDASLASELYARACGAGVATACGRKGRPDMERGGAPADARGSAHEQNIEVRGSVREQKTGVPGPSSRVH